MAEKTRHTPWESYGSSGSCTQKTVTWCAASEVDNQLSRRMQTHMRGLFAPTGLETGALTKCMLSGRVVVQQCDKNINNCQKERKLMVIYVSRAMSDSANRDAVRLRNIVMAFVGGFLPPNESTAIWVNPCYKDTQNGHLHSKSRRVVVTVTMFTNCTATSSSEMRMRPFLIEALLPI